MTRLPAFHALVVIGTLLAGLPVATAQDEDDSPEARAELIIAMIEEATKRSDAGWSVLSGVDPRTASADIRELARTIRTRRMTLKFEKLAATDVVDLLRQVTGLNFVITGAARRKLETDTPTVSLELRNLPLENVLNLIAMQLGEYRFILRYGAVVLVTSEEFRPRRVLRIYDITDLLYTPPDFPAPKLGLTSPDEER